MLEMKSAKSGQKHKSKISNVISANSHSENFVNSPRQESTSSIHSSVKAEENDREFWFAFLDVS